LAHRQRVEETGNRPLEMVEPVVEIRVVTPVLHQTASMSDGGAITLEKETDLVRLTPQPIWARYIATCRANAVRAEPRVRPRRSSIPTSNTAATADSIAHLTREVPTLSPAR
jgi:hypothetical protein